MKLRARWKALPWDAKLGYVTAGLFAAWFCVRVLVGPSLYLALVGCLMQLVLALLVLVLAGSFAVCSPRRSRVLPLLLTFGCFAKPFVAHDLEVDLHLMLCVYQAGGPNDLNDWAQELIRERQGLSQEEQDRSTMVDDEQIPPGVRAHLPGSTHADRDGVRIERGGGFFHYGVFVLPKGQAPPASRWQRMIGWPPEVFVYHED